MHSHDCVCACSRAFAYIRACACVCAHACVLSSQTDFHAASGAAIACDIGQTLHHEDREIINEHSHKGNIEMSIIYAAFNIISDYNYVMNETVLNIENCYG